MCHLNPIDFLVYTSTATSLFNDEQLLELLSTARTVNASHNVTGALLYRNGIFVQLLEGPAESVERIRQKIYRDPRHGGIVTLMHGQAEKRVFSDWTMHFIAVKERSLLEMELGYHCLKGQGDLEEMLEVSGQYKLRTGTDELHPGLRLLLTFRQVM